MSYKTFRAKYPQGSLVTQLLQIDHGQYIVQCLISDSDRTIASGLAGDRTIETAEDRAIERALRLLAIEDNSEVKAYFTNSVPNLEISVENKAIPKEYLENLDKHQEEVLRKFNYKIVDEPENRSTVDMEQASIFSNTFSEEIFNIESIIPKEIEQLKTESSETFLACQNFDFSEVIAKTNIELKRLNWSTQQGREYLMSKYGKRSRQLLSDEELLEFLQYLEAQPTEMEI